MRISEIAVDNCDVMYVNYRPREGSVCEKDANMANVILVRFLHYHRV